VEHYKTYIFKQKIEGRKMKSICKHATTTWHLSKFNPRAIHVGLIYGGQNGTGTGFLEVLLFSLLLHLHLSELLR
jgi:hypothetical protein